ncbi:MAG: carboxypeptidase regulatory-like domain-containing protein, partial [Pyrinomonadaceae bacterium]
MYRQKIALTLMVAIGVLFLTSTAIRAQVTTANIYGNVTDSGGAQLPGAVVTITNDQTSATQSATTNDEGEFTFNFLQVGRYSLSIAASGFKEQTQNAIELTGGQRVRLNYELEVGAITEKVLVTTEAPLINAVNAEQLISHNTVEVRELPLARRDWTNLLNIGTGVEVRASGGGTGVVLNGLPPGGISLTVDGTQGSGSSEETSITSFGNFNLIKVVSLEAISEVNVTKGIVPAEYSNTLSGNIGIITKSGTNEFHGSLFENYLGRFLNARSQFAATRPNEVFNQFGGSIGGPIIKNKLFFFGVYEGYRQRRFTNRNEQVPTPEFRASAIAAVPAYKAFFDAFPLPTQPYAVGAQTSAFIGTTPVTANDNHFVIRGDYNVNDTNRISSRYTRGRPDSLSFLSTVYPFLFTGLDDTFTTSYFRTGASYSSETRFGFNRNDVTRLLGVELESGGIPAIFGFNFSPGGGEVLTSRGKSWSIEQIVAFNRGRHSIKLGGIFQHQNQTRENVESAS